MIIYQNVGNQLTLSWWRSLSYRKQSIDLQSKSIDWFLNDRGLHDERVQHLQQWQTIIVWIEQYQSFQNCIHRSSQFFKINSGAYFVLTLSWQRSLYDKFLYEWFLYGKGVRHERVKTKEDSHLQLFWKIIVLKILPKTRDFFLKLQTGLKVKTPSKIFSIEFFELSGIAVF